MCESSLASCWNTRRALRDLQIPGTELVKWCQCVWKWGIYGCINKYKYIYIYIHTHHGGMYAAKIAMQMVSNGNNDLIFPMGDSTGGSGASCTSWSFLGLQSTTLWAQQRCAQLGIGKGCWLGCEGMGHSYGLFQWKVSGDTEIRDGCDVIIWYNLATTTS